MLSPSSVDMVDFAAIDRSIQFQHAGFCAGLRRAALGRYIGMRTEGQSHNMAVVLASRSFPGVKTDSVFNEGRFSGEAGQLGVEQAWLRKQAEDAGVSTNGKYYLRGLADYPGDPTAWVDSRGDVLRVAEAKGMTVHGYVEYEAPKRDPLPEPATLVADDIIDREVNEIIGDNRELGSMREAIRDDVYQHRSGIVDHNPLLVSDNCPSLEEINSQE